MEVGIVDAVIQTVAEVALGGLGSSSASTKCPVETDLRRQLEESRKANRSLCDFLKDEFGLTNQQIANAHTYKSKKLPKEKLTNCPHCKQRLFSRNTPTCNHCGGNLLVSDR